MLFSAATPETDGSWLDNATVPVALVTLAILGVCTMIGFLIAKAVDHCYDRQAIRDDVSDISEFTKELLKAQFLYSFNKKLIGKVKSNETVKQRARRLGRIWVAKARKNLREQNVIADQPEAAKDGATLTSVKVIGVAGADKANADQTSEKSKADSKPKEEKSSNTNNNQGTTGKKEEVGARAVAEISAEDPGTSTNDEKQQSGGADGKKGTKSPPAKRKGTRKSPTRNKPTGSPKRRKKAGNGKKKKKRKPKKRKVDVAKTGSDVEAGREESEASGSESGSDADSDSDDDNSDDAKDGGVTSAAHVTSAPCRDNRGRPATTSVEKETTGSECSSRDDYEFLKNSARVTRKQKQPDEAWGSVSGTSPTRGRASGTVSKLSMSVDSSLL